MQCNIGKNDKNIRLALGALIVLWGLLYQNWWGLIGLVLLITAFISWCPLYAVLGIKTCTHADKKSEESGSVVTGSGEEEREQEMAMEEKEGEAGDQGSDSLEEEGENTDEEELSRDA